MFGGLGGVAFATCYLSQEGRRYRGLAGILDRELFSLISNSVDSLDTSSGGVPVGDYDLMSGITGAGVYLLCRAEVSEEARSVLDRVLRSLVLLSEERDGLPRWFTPRDKIFPRQREWFPNGYMNCGMSHGIPGPLALLSLAESFGFIVPGSKDAIERIADWLTTHRSDDLYGVNWPTPSRCRGPSELPITGRPASQCTSVVLRKPWGESGTLLGRSSLGQIGVLPPCDRGHGSVDNSTAGRIQTADPCILPWNRGTAPSYA